MTTKRLAVIGSLLFLSLLPLWAPSAKGLVKTEPKLAVYPRTVDAVVTHREYFKLQSGSFVETTTTTHTISSD
jgi:hypothetical protein